MPAILRTEGSDPFGRPIGIKRITLRDLTVVIYIPNGCEFSADGLFQDFLVREEGPPLSVSNPNPKDGVLHVS